MFLSFVEPSLVRTHLDSPVVGVHEVLRLLEERAIPAGTPVFLEDRTMLPVEPLNGWFRHLAYEDKDPKTLREYAYIMGDSSPFCMPGAAMDCLMRRSPTWRLIADRAPSCKPARWAKRRGPRKPSC